MNELIEEVSEFGMFAFDMHSHSFRSYLGYTCFIEIST